MQPGDLVRIRAGFLGAGLIGVVVGPSKDTGDYPWGARGNLDVLFSDGTFAVHPTSLVRAGSARRAPG